MHVVWCPKIDKVEICWNDRRRRCFKAKMQRLNNWQAGCLRSHVLFLWPSAQTNILRYCQKLGKCLNESHHIWPIQKTSPTLVERRNRRKHDVLFRHAHFCAVMWLGESIWKDAWNIMKPTCCNCDRKNKAWSYVLARLGTSWDRTKWPWRRRNRHPQTGEPSSGSHSFQKCSVSWTCLALSFTKGTRCTSSNVKRCEEMRRDVKWCEVMWSDVKWCEVMWRLKSTTAVQKAKMMPLLDLQLFPHLWLSFPWRASCKSLKHVSFKGFNVQDCGHHNLLWKVKTGPRDTKTTWFCTAASTKSMIHIP